MHATIKRLQYKGEQVPVILNSPPSFLEVLKDWESDTTVSSRLNAKNEFVLAFVLKSNEIEPLIASVVKTFSEDAKFWVAYPKKSSKNFKSDISRDHSWGLAGDHGFEAVRMISIDQDWSAIRFRKVGFIKTMTRETIRALTNEGKKKTITSK